MITNLTKNVVSLANRVRQAILARFLMTEDSDFITTEGGKRLVLEFSTLSGNLNRNNASLTNVARS